MKKYRISYMSGDVSYVVIVKLDAKSPEEAHHKFTKLSTHVETDTITKIEELP